MRICTPRACQLVKEQIDKWPNRNHRHIQLLKALVDLTISNPQQAVEGFTTRDLHAEVSEMIRKPWGSEDAIPKTVSASWKKLNKEVWPTKIDGLRQRSLDGDMEGYPALKKDQGGGGAHSSRYYLTSIAFTDEELTETSQSISNMDPSMVRYYQDETSEAGMLSQWLVSGFQLTGWRKKAFLTFGITAALICGITFWFFGMLLFHMTTFHQALTSAIAASMVAWFLWRTLGPFYEVIFRNSAVAPGWLQSLRGDDDWLLIFKRRQPEAPNLISLVRYQGTCPACGGNLEIGKGGQEFKGRLVGRCSNSAREHIYSFDHQLRIGKPLRHS